MAMRPKLWSLSGLSTELGRNVRTVSRALAKVPADGQLNGHPAWRIATAIAALARHESNSDQLSGRARRYNHGGADGEDLLQRIERTSNVVDEGMRRLRAAAPDLRLKILEGFGHQIGTLDRLLEATIGRQGQDAIATLSPFRDAVVGGLVREVGELLSTATRSDKAST